MNWKNGTDVLKHTFLLLLFTQNFKYTKNSRPLRSIIEKTEYIILTFEATNKNVYSKLNFRFINILIRAAICITVMKELF